MAFEVIDCIGTDVIVTAALAARVITAIGANKQVFGIITHGVSFILSACLRWQGELLRQHDVI
jgi:hypothetical protein